MTIRFYSWPQRNRFYRKTPLYDRFFEFDVQLETDGVMASVNDGARFSGVSNVGKLR